MSELVGSTSALVHREGRVKALIPFDSRASTSRDFVKAQLHVSVLMRVANAAGAFGREICLLIRQHLAREQPALVQQHVKGCRVGLAIERPVWKLWLSFLFFLLK